MTTRGQALDFFRDHVLGISEQPPGSNHAPPITDGFWDDSWCSMGCSYVLTNVGIGLHMALVQNVINMAKRGDDGWSWHTGDPIPGDLVTYDWGDGGIADHIGMLEAVRDDGRLITLECNTRYNDARRMVRAWDSTVLGFARPPYAESPAPVPAPTPTLPKGVDVFTFRAPNGEIFLADLGTQKAVHLSPDAWGDLKNPPPHIELTEDNDFSRYFTVLKV